VERKPSSGWRPWRSSEPPRDSVRFAVVALIGVILSNLTSFLTLAYVYVNALGILYSWSLYKEFGINIFDYAEIGDFLLAALKNPYALFLLGGQVLIYLLILIIVTIVERTFDKRFAVYAGDPAWLRRRTTLVVRAATLLASIAVLIGTIWAPQWFALRDAQSLKQGNQPTLEVRYRSSSSGSVGQVTQTRLELIGTTQRVACF
jgi:hypothetical protein